MKHSDLAKQPQLKPSWWLIVLGLVLTILSSSCTYTYIPPIPRGRAEPDPSLDLHASSGIQHTAQGLTLLLTAQDVPEANWLAVQWFAPDNTQVASASQWLTPNRDPQEIRFRLPADISVTDGDWRAVVSFQNRVARQFSLPIGELDLQADDDADTPTPDAPLPEDDIPEGTQPEPEDDSSDASESNDVTQDEPSSSDNLNDGAAAEDESSQDETPTSPEAIDESPTLDAP
ncbi:MAG: hypothetical protein AAF267_06545 [Deinococcota bacterium]